MDKISVNPEALSPVAREKVFPLVRLLDSSPDIILRDLAPENAGSVGNLIDTTNPADWNLYISLAEAADQKAGNASKETAMLCRR
ncbi:MAG: hypothetical protein WCT32_04605 [Patescibacteria group bacterium]